jgi:hypothetical protein
MNFRMFQLCRTISRQVERCCSLIPQQQWTVVRTMGGGPRTIDPNRDPVREARLKALKKARKAASKLLGPKPKEVPSPSVYNGLLSWIDKPVSPKIEGILPHMEKFIIEEWLPRYPEGARIRKLQRDVAFRMERKHRPGKLPYQVLMPVVGRLVRQGSLKTRMASDGACLIYHPDGKDEEVATNAVSVISTQGDDTIQTTEEKEQQSPTSNAQRDSKMATLDGRKRQMDTRSNAQSTTTKKALVRNPRLTRTPPNAQAKLKARGGINQQENVTSNTQGVAKMATSGLERRMYLKAIAKRDRLFQKLVRSELEKLRAPNAKRTVNARGGKNWRKNTTSSTRGKGKMKASGGRKQQVYGATR